MYVAASKAEPRFHPYSVAIFLILNFKLSYEILVFMIRIPKFFFAILKLALIKDQYHSSLFSDDKTVLQICLTEGIKTQAIVNCPSTNYFRNF